MDYVQENALKGRTFDSLAQQNAHLDHWEQTVADTRIHGTTKQHVGVRFESLEKASLKLLPKDRFPYYEEGRRKVSRDGHIAVNSAYYSVPAEYLGHEVWVRWNSQTVRNQSAAQQQTLSFLDDHPIVRPVAEYGDFIRRSIQGD